MGRLMYESLMGRDYPNSYPRINLILAVLVVVTNLGVDLIMGGWIPRISLPIEASTGWSNFL